MCVRTNIFSVQRVVHSYVHKTPDQAHRCVPNNVRISSSCLYRNFLFLNSILKFESLVVQNNSTSSDVAGIILLNGVVSSIIGTQLYIKSLTRLSPVTVNVLWSLSIPLTVVVDYVRGTVHTVSSTFLLGALLVLLSTVLVPIEQEETTVSDNTLQRDIPLLVISEESSSEAPNGDCNPDLEAHILLPQVPTEMREHARSSS